MEYFIINTDASSFGGPHDLNVWFKNNLAFTGGSIEYGEQLSRLSPGDSCLMYENKCGVVAIGRVLEKWNGKAYRKQIYYDDDDTEYRIKVDWSNDRRENPITVADLKRILGYQPRGAVRRIGKRRAEISIVIDNILSKQKFVLPEEIQDTETLTEGARETITGDVYERNEKARQRCIEHWGFTCNVCGMRFEQTYGPIGHEYIHVHHLKSLVPCNINKHAQIVRGSPVYVQRNGLAFLLYSSINSRVFAARSSFELKTPRLIILRP